MFIILVINYFQYLENIFAYRIKWKVTILKIGNLMYETILIWLKFFLGLWMQYGVYLACKGLGLLSSMKTKAENSRKPLLMMGK